MDSNQTNPLRILLLNAENLFLYFDTPPQVPIPLDLDDTKWAKHSASTRELKSLQKLFGIKRLIEQTDPDLVLLCEIGGEESLKNFNHYFLDSKFSVALLEGNSDRGIDVGFLIQKRIGAFFDIQSNRTRNIDPLGRADAPENIRRNPLNRFSRDVAELRFFTHTRDKPSLVLLLTHLKSPLDPDQTDPNGFKKRTLEVKAMIDIYEEIEKELGPNANIVVAGDFNGIAQKHRPDVEFQEIYQRTGLQDVLELAGVSLQNRNTFFHFKNSGPTEGRQIDYCFLSPNLHSHLKAESVRIESFRDPLGHPIAFPKTLEQKNLLPSDHFPIFFILDNLKLD